MGNFINGLVFILIYSRTQEEHDMHVRTVLERLHKNKLYVNLSKWVRCRSYQFPWFHDKFTRRRNRDY
jgi:hypothetical protein